MCPKVSQETLIFLPRYDFQFDPKNPLMAEFAHYQNMHNVHYYEEIIRREFSEFKIVKLKKVIHPVQSHRFIWEVILQIDALSFHPHGGKLKQLKFSTLKDSNKCIFHQKII